MCNFYSQLLILYLKYLPNVGSIAFLIFIACPLHLPLSKYHSFSGFVVIPVFLDLNFCKYNAFYIILITYCNISKLVQKAVQNEHKQLIILFWDLLSWLDMRMRLRLMHAGSDVPPAINLSLSYCVASTVVNLSSVHCFAFVKVDNESGFQ